MMRQSNTPAEQLGSMCLRYAGPWRLHLPQAGHVARIPGVETVAPDETVSSDADLAMARLEAILFLAREPLSSRKLSQYASLADGTQARTLVRRLNERYDAAARAFRVEQVAGGYLLLTRRKFSPWLRRLAHVPAETRFSAPALETLAVIAYRQPVLRADLEAIRGVNCGEILRQLMDRDLVRIAGRSTELGRPYLYSTTRRFLELFGLNHTDDLPRAQELRACAVPSIPPAVPLNPPPEEVSSEPIADFSCSPIDEIACDSTLG